jgi:heat shock protein HspQ
MSELDTDIDLGDTARDTISGYEGVVTAIADHLTGCTRVEISQSESQIASSEWFYAEQLTTDVEDLERDFTHDVVTDTDLQLGQRVRDSVTGYEGHIITITYELFNCPRVLVQTGGEDKETEGFDRPRIEALGDGVVDQFSDSDDNDVGETGAAPTDIERSVDRV